VLIKGLTHDEKGVLNAVEKYRGKISTGYAPNEGPNKRDYPIAAGFFRMLKEVTTTERVGNSETPVTIKSWILNEEIQTALEKTLDNKIPRRIELVSFYKTPQEMWESCLAMFSSTDGLLCKSHGLNQNARQLTFSPDGDRIWIDRLFDGKKGCLYHDCPDFKTKKCKPMGSMKCFPVIDLTPNPYRLETRSINTIMGIESSFAKLWNLLNVAHAIKEQEVKKTLKFDGFFGAKLYLVHKKIKSGGRDVFITDLLPTPSFIDEVMEPVKRGLNMKQKQAKVEATPENLSLLELAESSLLGTTVNNDTAEEPVPLELEDQQHVAKEFGADAAKEESQEMSKETQNEVAETLLNNNDKEN